MPTVVILVCIAVDMLLGFLLGSSPYFDLDLHGAIALSTGALPLGRYDGFGEQGFPCPFADLRAITLVFPLRILLSEFRASVCTLGPYAVVADSSFGKGEGDGKAIYLP